MSFSFKKVGLPIDVAKEVNEVPISDELGNAIRDLVVRELGHARFENEPPKVIVSASGHTGPRTLSLNVNIETVW